jgi:uncharacterized protein YdeI (YjbR/CyaY-like superfamily)
MKGAANAEAFILSNPQWQDSLVLLQKIFRSAGLEETIKWGVPVYTSAGKNVAGMACFKSYVGIWFYQGALLHDEGKKLITAREGVTKALRQWRFSSFMEIEENHDTIVAYIRESVENAQKGLEIKAEKNLPLEIPEELLETFNSDMIVKEAFDALSLTKKRDFTEYILTAKRVETKMARINKIVPMILRGEGLNDKYAR